MIHKCLGLEIELLKKQVFIKAGLKSVGIADISPLTSQIKKETDLDFSQVTLSRLFGYTDSKFGPSLFTLHVLSVYCGCESWDMFKEKNSRNGCRPRDLHIQKLFKLKQQIFLVAVNLKSTCRVSNYFSSQYFSLQYHLASRGCGRRLNLMGKQADGLFISLLNGKVKHR